MRTEKLETREIHDLCLAKAKRIVEEAELIVACFSDPMYPHMREHYRSRHVLLTTLEETVAEVSSACGNATREIREQHAG